MTTSSADHIVDVINARAYISQRLGDLPEDSLIDGDTTLDVWAAKQDIYDLKIFCAALASELNVFCDTGEWDKLLAAPAKTTVREFCQFVSLRSKSSLCASKGVVAVSPFSPSSAIHGSLVRTLVERGVPQTRLTTSTPISALTKTQAHLLIREITLNWPHAMPQVAPESWMGASCLWAVSCSAVLALCLLGLTFISTWTLLAFLALLGFYSVLYLHQLSSRPTFEGIATIGDLCDSIAISMSNDNMPPDAEEGIFLSPP